MTKKHYEKRRELNFESSDRLEITEENATWKARNRQTTSLQKTPFNLQENENL